MYELEAGTVALPSEGSCKYVPYRGCLQLILLAHWPLRYMSPRRSIVLLHHCVHTDDTTADR